MSGKETGRLCRLESVSTLTRDLVISRIRGILPAWGAQRRMQKGMPMSLQINPGVVTILLAIASPAVAQPLPDAIVAPGETAFLTLFAEGAQVYDCKADAQGRLVWTFREPIATLIQDGRTVGRHYAGPHWELADGSIVMGKVTGRAPGASAADIPLLKLETVVKKEGALAQAATIQRINTKGGQLEGSCDKAGGTRSVAYSTDYVFLKK
jgi:Protein of unknown function (DUF3455)